jgi:predicted P-loop ATPase/GTPase
MKGESRAWECPRCGFNYFKKQNYSKKINELLKVRNLKTKTQLRTIAQLIRVNVPSDSGRDKYYFFLYAMKDVNNQTLLWGLDEYYKGKHYLKGKGYPYLKAIILSRDKNKERMSANERKLIGSAPPIIK